MKKVTKNLVLEDARILFPNFSGREERFNPAGSRNFCVILPEKTYQVAENLGWNVKYLVSKDDPEDKVPYLQVTVRYDNIPPKVVMITSKGKTILNEDTISQLDFADIKSADMVISPYNWNVNGKSGVKAYLKTLYITLDEDEFERKYTDISDENYEDGSELPF